MMALYGFDSNGRPFQPNSAEEELEVLLHSQGFLSSMIPEVRDEVDSLLARGVIAPEEYKQAFAEGTRIYLVSSAACDCLDLAIKDALCGAPAALPPILGEAVDTYPEVGRALLVRIDHLRAVYHGNT